MEERPAIVRPGQFGLVVAADARRGVFDSHNEQLIAQRVPVAVVFAGDSITEGWDLDAFFQSPEGLIVNRGIGGDTTPYLRRRFEADVLQLRPRLVVLLIGINNTWGLDQWTDPSTLPSAGEIEEQIVTDVEEMVQTAVAKGITVALCSILPTDIRPLSTTPARNELVARTNTRLRELAQRYGTTYVDYHAPMAQEDGLTVKPGLADDGLHPHIAGYRLMARALLKALQDGAAGFIQSRD